MQKPVHGRSFVFNLHAQRNGLERKIWDLRTQTHTVLLGCRQGCRIRSSRLSRNALKIAGCITMVIGEGKPRRDVQARALDACEKLLRSRDPAKHNYGAINLRNFHPPMQSPNCLLPTLSLDPIRNFGLVCRNRDYVRPFCCMQYLAQIAGWKQMIMQIGATQQQNLHISMELAMLKSIVEQMRPGLRTR